ncbi:C-type lectin domain family 10 member A-like isoform X3 [Anarhichas minor]|uniref:C-type lectin domain family 10 member A-like isoform X3 n=1 Tax=Anarhichas minor TaxID=65739 RepID=UPI003F73D849
MKTDYQLENEIDDSTIWFKDGPPVYFSGVSRFRRWLFPGLTATIILILIIALGASSSAADGCCPPGWDQFGFNCFFFSFESLSWNESRIWCENHEAHLVIIHKDQTRWVPGQPDSWADHGLGHGDEDCAHLHKTADASTTCTAPPGCASSVRNTAS